MIIGEEIALIADVAFEAAEIEKVVSEFYGGQRLGIAGEVYADVGTGGGVEVFEAEDVAGIGQLKDGRFAGAPMQGVDLDKVAADEGAGAFERVPLKRVVRGEGVAVNRNHDHLARHVGAAAVHIEELCTLGWRQGEELLLQVEGQARKGVIIAAFAEDAAPEGEGPDGGGDDGDQGEE